MSAFGIYRDLLHFSRYSSVVNFDRNLTDISGVENLYNLYLDDIFMVREKSGEDVSLHFKKTAKRKKKSHCWHIRIQLMREHRVLVAIEPQSHERKYCVLYKGISTCYQSECGRSQN